MHCVSSLPPADSCHTAPTSVRRSNRRPRLSTASYEAPNQDRKSTRLNSSHSQISYAVFCLKKKKNIVEPAVLLALLLIEPAGFGIYPDPIGRHARDSACSCCDYNLSLLPVRSPLQRRPDH